MAGLPSDYRLSLAKIIQIVSLIIGGERDYYILALIYGLGVSLLSLALPISVQMLINTVASTGLILPLTVLSLTLFGLLLFSGLLSAMRIHLMEIFARRFYARMTSEIALRSIYAANPFFHDLGKGALFNRYFDIVTVQKAVPYLLIGGFTVLLQTVTGFALVSLYHPFFLAFVIAFILLVWAIFASWTPSAARSSIALSHSKHAAAAWLQSIAGSNGFFKSDRHIAYALDKTDDDAAGYVLAHKKHFRLQFTQTVLFLILYAAASAALLGLGGWLVIQGQLTLGQLVAAELILSAAFAGVAQLGSYLASFYDLCAAAEELSLFFEIEQEEPSGAVAPESHDATLSFRSVKGDARGTPATFNLVIPGGTKLMAAAPTHGVQRLFSNLLKRHVEPLGGILSLGGVDILSMEVHALRRRIVVIDRPTVIEMTIRDYLALSSESQQPDEISEVVRVVGLEPAIASLEMGFDTELAVTGWPLSITETMQLKLAAAILARPRVLILNQLLDVIPASQMKAIIRYLRDRAPEMTLIVFSNRDTGLELDGFLHLDFQHQEHFQNFEKFTEATGVTHQLNHAPAPLLEGA
ncbi:MAG: ABC transporter ATP-binding protein [Amphiplicatus sp.]|nr:ABC transporter ATP-binding protein [Amphiplicatus sp.]